MVPTRPPAAPPQEEDDPAGEAGDEAEHPVHQCGGEALGRSPPARPEADRGDGLPGAPAPDPDGHHHGQQGQHQQREQLTQRGAAPGGPCGDDEEREVPGQRRDRQQDHPRPGAEGEHARADVGEAPPQRGADPGPARSAHRSGPQDGDGGEDDDQPDDDGPAGDQGADRGLEQLGPGEQRPDPDDHRHHQTGGPFEDDRADAPSDVAGPAAVAHRPVHVAEHPHRQHGVQEQRPVAVRDRLCQSQGQAEAAGHEAPAPGAEHGREQAGAECGEHRTGVDRPQPVEDGVAAQPCQQRGQDAEADQGPKTRPERRHHAVPAGRASTSTWPTTTRSRPAAQASSRSRR